MDSLSSGIIGERGKSINEIILRYSQIKVNQRLSLGNAELLAVELSNLPEKKLMEVGIYIMGKSNDFAVTIINAVKLFPSVSVKEAHSLYLGRDKDTHLELKLDRETYKALKRACVDKQKRGKELIIETLRMWLIVNGYLSRSS